MMDGAPSDLAVNLEASDGLGARLPITGGAESLAARIARRWWVIAVAMLVAVVFGFVYLLLATPVYSVVAVLATERTRAASASDIPPAEFMNAQRALILSPAVLDSAATGGSGESLRDGLSVRADKGEGTITITLDTPRPPEGAMTVSRIIDAYFKAYQRQQVSAATGLTELSAARDHAAAERSTREKALLEVQARTAAAGDAGKAAAGHLAQLTQALTAAQLDAAKAAAAVQTLDAAQDKPDALRQLIESARPSGIFAALDQKRAAAQKDLDQLEPQYARQRDTLLPKHPALLETQRKMESLRKQIAEIDKQYVMVYRVHLDQQRTTTLANANQLEAVVEVAKGRAGGAGTDAAKIAELEAALKQADGALATADAKLKDAVAGGGNSGMVVKLVQPAVTPSRPTHPQRARVLLTAAIIGMIAGLALAAVAGRR